MHDTRHESIPLNDAQRRHYAVLLATLEESIADLEAIAAGHHRTGRLKRVERDLRADIVVASRPHLAAVRKELVELANLLALGAGSSSAARKFQALALTSAVQIEDSTSRHLRAYGAVDPRVPELIDPPLARMHESFSALAGLAANTPTRENLE